MNYLQVYNETRKLLDKHELPFYNIRLSDSTKFLGRCFFRKGDNPGFIEFSSIHLATSNDSQILDTIRHEVAHAIRHEIPLDYPLERVYGKIVKVTHDVEWRRIATSLGATPKACADFQLPKRFHLTCSCGFVYYSQSRR